MSSQPTAKMGITNRIWSHNTNYTGAAGIHSEDGPIAHARNSLMDRRSSAAITAEEEMLKKRMKSLGVSRKSLETSMLSYSQKMKDIAEKRERLIKSCTLNSPSQKESNLSSTGSHCSKNIHDINTNNKTQPKENNPRRIESRTNISYSSLSDQKEYKTNSLKEDSCLVNTLYPANAITDQRGRISVDSGFGMDSDSYVSDADSVPKTLLSSSSSWKSEDSFQSETVLPLIGRTSGRNGVRYKRKRYQCAEKIELATVVDTDCQEEGDEEKEHNNTANVDEPVTISPFPENDTYRDTDGLASRLESISEYESLSDDLNRTRILGPLSSSPLKPRKYKAPETQKPKKKTPHVLTKPKVIYSPSLAALRRRRANKKANRKNYKPHRHAFKYSEAVETALRSLNNSPEFRRDSTLSNTSPSVSPDLPGLDLNELLNELFQRPSDLDILLPDESEEIEIKPHRLIRERSFSDSFTKPPSFINPLEQVREDDDSELRSVLRKNNIQYPAEKKSVQFFLPDIFMQANACTSRPTALR